MQLQLRSSVIVLITAFILNLHVTLQVNKVQRVIFYFYCIACAASKKDNEPCMHFSWRIILNSLSFVTISIKVLILFLEFFYSLFYLI